MMAKRLLTLAVLLTLVLPALAACGGTAATPTTVPVSTATSAPVATVAAATEAATTAPTAAATAAPTAATMADGVSLPEVDPATVTGDIIAAGSSTVFPLAERMSELFTKDGYTGQITVDSIGSGAGFERFCVAAETDIATASRAIKAEETAACAKNNRTPIEFRIGTDALAVVVSTENTFLSTLTKAQLASIYAGEAKTWKDVDASYPAEPILLFSPGTDSGTFDYFVEAIFAKDKTKILAANPQLSEDDNVLVQGVEGSPYAIGYFGYAYYLENKDKLKVLDIEGITPDAQTAEDGTYPLARPLFLYADATIMADKPQVAAFINFVLTNVSDEIGEVGYFPASAESLAAAKQAWLDAQ
ncbi:MAG: PstS family phosphate ABC transporter substrate-binding protein [Oscillochloris sp.]|nr:PstS family phosphate ABC transporter substrate-binding protein [Oscillochloris sp.]